jgi:NDP-hexose C3-ketoreductase / dTDP-4-oxo-2-deoxy-alpha-D-pentos-2-ene 2,3-reductase
MAMGEDGDLYARLGRAGLKVSRLGVGTVNFGGRVDEPAARRVLDRSLSHGINLVDTANIYGWRVYKGYTEELLGRWLASGSSRRDRVVLATKVGNPIGQGPNDRGFSARHIVSACEASLRRMRTDWIDLYQLHHVDRSVAWDEVWQAMELLMAQGKVRYVGSSNFAGWDIASAQAAAGRRQLFGLASEQCLYNLATRYPELEVLPAAGAYGLGVLVWSPLHGGLLGGVLGKLADGSAAKSAQGRAAAALKTCQDRIVRYEQFCADAGRHPAEVGLAWVLSRPQVCAVLIGPRTPEHVDDAVRALRQPLAADELRELDELFPPVGHGGPAPAAWIT